MRAIFHLIIMISYLLSCAHQTHDRINVYHVLIISYLYPTLYHILPLSYLDYQTDPKGINIYRISYPMSYLRVFDFCNLINISIMSVRLRGIYVMCKYLHVS